MTYFLRNPVVKYPGQDYEYGNLCSMDEMYVNPLGLSGEGVKRRRRRREADGSRFKEIRCHRKSITE